MPQFGGPEFSEEQMAAMDKDTKDAMEGAPAGGQGQEFAPDLKNMPSIPLRKDAAAELKRERTRKEPTASPEDVAKHEAWLKEVEETRKKYGKAA